MLWKITRAYLIRRLKNISVTIYLWYICPTNVIPTSGVIIILTSCVIITYRLCEVYFFLLCFSRIALCVTIMIDENVKSRKRHRPTFRRQIGTYLIICLATNACYTVIIIFESSIGRGDTLNRNGIRAPMTCRLFHCVLAGILADTTTSQWLFYTARAIRHIHDGENHLMEYEKTTRVPCKGQEGWRRKK